MTRRTPRPPISALALLQQEMGELVHRLSVLDRADRLPGSEWSPAVDVFEARDRLVVVIEVPGLPPESLRVAFRERELVLSAYRGFALEECLEQGDWIALCLRSRA